MTTHLRYALVGLILTCGTLAVTIGITRQDADVNRAAPVKGPYVALGDSYTAGPRIPGQTGAPVGCDRSDHNYPSLVAARLGLNAADFHDVSCSGATITDVSASQATDNGTNPPQLTALDDDTRLVTLGIGGNDIGFSSMIKRCVGMGALYQALGSGTYLREDAPCKRSYGDAGTDTVQVKIRQAGDRLSRALAEVGRQAPKARVYVVGYPAILPAEGNTGCLRALGLASGDVAFLRDTEQRLNSMLRDKAEAAGVGYVDTYAPSRGKDACSGESTRWIEPLLPLAPAAAVHPNARGERGMADAVLHALGT